MKAMMALLTASFSIGAAAQGTVVPLREDCIDSVIVSGESYDLSGGGSGHGINLDGLKCTERRWGFLAGASSFTLAESRWSLGRVGAMLRLPAGHVASATASVGSGHNEGGRFAYRKLAGAIAVKSTGSLFAKVEHEYFDIDESRGNVLKLGGIAVVAPGLSLDVTAARSIGGNLNARSISARGDWVGRAARAFIGLAHGRLLPQAADIATGERVPDVISRQAFGGVAVKLPPGELIAALDTTKTAGSRRNTWSLGLQIALP